MKELKELLEKNKKLYNNLNIKNFIEQKILLAEERAFSPDYDYSIETSIEEEFDCNIMKEFYEYRNFLRENIKYLEKELEQKEQIEEVTGELEPVKKYTIKIFVRG